ncbi:Uncharacterized protein conserved in bacteria with the myosin-like domain [Alloiococcus otitis]|uniref:Gp58-like domain-containing protein n=1 Tax=Alloiococcus otitis ATCC 51267 TaxID=883081 RepID=K9EAI9_9LACT|nr:gp58-like family protein [Alloiococcus otitis]EKU92841.1 hypothetical protein HMPREF9698_01625 [Alloiococcus otitis ATCC 51267]SUU80716.1 Uncharacterized protein conserved in bacteria with the myosin-like domain [Alloiococcus otitis]
MQIQLGDQVIPLQEGPDGRFQASFQATEGLDHVLIPSDCIGTLHVDDIQLEEGAKATPYVEPEIYTSEISGIFKDLKDLDLKIEDTELGLKTQIRINQSGLEQRIEDTRRGLESRLIATADTWQSQLKDTQQGLESQISQTASLWQSQLKNADANLRSVIQQTADSLVTLVEDTDSENFSKTEQLVNGLQSTVSGQVSRLDSRITSQVTQLKDLIASSIESATGEKSEIWQTLNAHNAQITNAQGDISRITQRVDSVQSQIRTVDGKQSTLSQTVTTLQGKVEDTEKKLRSTIQQTSDNIITLIEETDSKNLSKTEQLVNGMQSIVQGEINRQANRLDSRIDSERSYTRSQVTQLKDLISSRIESSTGDQSDIWQTLNSLGGQISSARGDISRVDRRVDSVQSRISSVEGDQSRLTQTVNSLDSRISNTRGDVSRLTQTVDGLSYDVRNSNGLLKTEIRNLAGQIDAKVTRGDVQSIIRSSGDAIWFAVESRVRNTANNAKMSGREIVSEINIASGGVRIKGDKIHLSGSTIIDSGIIRNDMIANGISANKITTGTLNANNVRVINLDVNSLSGNKARFVQLGIQGISRNIELDGRGVHIYRNDGSRSNLLSEKGIEFWRDGREHGQMSTLKAIDESGVFRNKYSVSLAVEDSAYISLSYRKRGESNFTRAIGINGENGNVHMNTLFPDSDEDRGLKFTSNRIWNSWGVQIWNSRPNNGGLLINDSGDVEIISGELFFRTWRAYNHSNAGTNGLELRAGQVGGQWGLFLEHTNSYRAGIFFGHNGHVYIRDTDGTYSKVRPNFN